MVPYVKFQQALSAYYRGPLDFPIALDAASSARLMQHGRPARRFASYFDSLLAR
jgi:hypothetical protein